MYLTADADDEISSFDPNIVYIIGGIVDRNRLKNATRRKADIQGVRAAKLPLDRYMDLGGSTRVLTIDCVFRMILTQIEHGDWSNTFSEHMPARKDGKLLDVDDDGEARADA